MPKALKDNEIVVKTLQQLQIKQWPQVKDVI